MLVVSWTTISAAWLQRASLQVSEVATVLGAVNVPLVKLQCKRFSKVSNARRNCYDITTGDIFNNKGFSESIASKNKSESGRMGFCRPRNNNICSRNATLLYTYLTLI